MYLLSTFNGKHVHPQGDYSSDPPFDEKASIMNKMFNIPEINYRKQTIQAIDMDVIGRTQILLSANTCIWRKRRK